MPCLKTLSFPHWILLAPFSQANRQYTGVRYFLASLACSVDLCVCFCARSKSFCFDYYSFLIEFEISNPSLKLCSSFSRSLVTLKIFFLDSLVFCDLIQQNRPRRDGKSTQKNCTKKYLNDPDNHNGVVSHSESDILECEVKWALGSPAAHKASGGDRILAELFKILKDDAIKVLHSICQEIWKSQQWPEDWKRSILISVPKKGSTKECSSH